jgi:signal transduction histidine kinase
MSTEKDLLSYTAHQLRNPLNSISINAELARLQLQKQQDPKEIILSIDRILQECKHCAELLNELNPPK